MNNHDDNYAQYEQDLLEEALTANKSRKDFDAARAIITIPRAEVINRS